ncbi:MAG TPA: SDR family oxidoreductase [Burkholderiales bacterium]|nr:SDR family oxidoreductase [Burkholderiales bacterium]
MTNPQRLLITGANGFVGRALCEAALVRGFAVKAATRSPCWFSDGIESAVIGPVDGETDWTSALAGVDVVIHLAARVHVMRESALDPLAEFRRVNAAGTAQLARSAAAAGAQRLVYVSTIKVNGEETTGERRYSELDGAAPQDAYGVSKWEAEQALHKVSRETGLQVVIVRPPLVYGAGVKGNFAQMLRAVARGVPLPLASVDNRRDLLYVGNLVDALLRCAVHPAAAGQTFLLSDGEPVSTPELLRRLAQALGVAGRLFPFPPALLKLAGKLTGRSAQIERLLGSLQIDSGKIRRELDWQPPYSLEQGLRDTAAGMPH